MSTTSAQDFQAASVPSDARICKACRRILATVTPEGDLVPSQEQDAGCELCKPILSLYNEYQECSALFEEFKDRRPNYRPRELAVEVMREAQMNLGNFLENVVAWNGVGDANSIKLPEVQLEEQREEQTHPPPETPVQQADAQSLRHKRSLSSHSSPGKRKPAKRPQTLESKRRVSFDSSVVFRDADVKRVDAEFSRASEGYSPGRYAAPNGSEWLDTSGNKLTEVKFFGIKKQGQKWVPTKEGLQMDEEWQSKSRNGDVEEEGLVESEGDIGGKAAREAEEPEPQVETGHQQGDLTMTSTEAVFPECSKHAETNISQDGTLSEPKLASQVASGEACGVIQGDSYEDMEPAGERQPSVSGI